MKFRAAFTFVELMVVIAILSVVAVFVIADYRGATDRTRVQLATEELMSLMEKARVNTQAGVGGGSAQCYGVHVQSEVVPEFYEVEWDSVQQRCNVESTVLKESLSWSLAEVAGLVWQRFSEAGLPLATDSGDELWFIFAPPNGTLNVYNVLSDGPLERLDYACVSVRRPDRVDDRLDFGIKIVPSVVTFDMLSSCDDV